MNRYIMGFFSVFPACAGVILPPAKGQPNRMRIPRMRGGDPWSFALKTAELAYSPHARG